MRDIQTSAFDQTIRTAIAQKRLIRIRYMERVRVAEPHDYGVQKGVERLLVYQLRGTPRTPGQSAIGWRLLELAKIEECLALDESFPGSRGDQHTRRLIWDTLYARVT